MLTFIIGESHRGKSTFAEALSKRNHCRVITASKFIRELSGISEHTKGSTESLTELSLNILKDDPLFFAKYLEKEIGSLHEAIIDGCRNPTDILYLARSGDHIVDLGGHGLTEWEQNGLMAIRSCQKHLERLNVTWANYHRNFCTLPQPLAVSVESKYLFGDNRLGTEPGHIIALEYYTGLITGCWKSLKDGGVFHDLPLQAFVTTSLGFDPDDAVEYLRAHQPMPEEISNGNCYSVTGRGDAIIELSPIQGEVSVFNRMKEKIGIGESLWMMHWPADNLLLHLINLNGRLFLWPPHKLLWNPETEHLPKWKKLK